MMMTYLYPCSEREDRESAPDKYCPSPDDIVCGRFCRYRHEKSQWNAGKMSILLFIFVIFRYIFAGDHVWHGKTRQDSESLGEALLEPHMTRANSIANLLIWVPKWKARCSCSRLLCVPSPTTVCIFKNKLLWKCREQRMSSYSIMKRQSI